MHKIIYKHRKLYWRKNEETKKQKLVEQWTKTISF